MTEVAQFRLPAGKFYVAPDYPRSIQRGSLVVRPVCAETEMVRIVDVRSRLMWRTK